MKIYLTAEQAIFVLPDSDSVHTFVQSGLALVGADWSRPDIADKLKASYVIELTGHRARGMGHGICAYSKDAKYQSDVMFIETDEARLSTFEKELEALKDGSRHDE